MDTTHQVTDLLQRAGRGDVAALDQAFPLVYEHLRRLAHRELAREVTGHTLDTTALVHEAYLRLVDQRRGGYQDRAHFLAMATVAMRRILVDHARQHTAAKRGGGAQRVPLDVYDDIPAPERADLIVALDEALSRLAQLDLRQARVVECRFFGGLTEDETGEVLGMSVRTVKRDWAKARAWLHQELYPEATG
jgi:RNA polymerase sigma factor (TIGR02999 family)